MMYGLNGGMMGGIPYFHLPWKKGVEKAYLHLDGWGKQGYDNLHPDPFPPHEEAGGVEGMRRLADTCDELGYYFGIHDQYRDYYYDSPGFTLDNAVQYFDGSHFLSDYWYGGAHTFLCSALAPDYVRRNYDEFERLGLKPDGSYLDVFSVVELDECFNPAHRVTREGCAQNRRHCLDMLSSRGIIPSSEEGVDYVKKRTNPAKCTLWCAAVDEELTAKSYIVPGIGDAGDLAYGEKL